MNCINDLTFCNFFLWKAMQLKPLNFFSKKSTESNFPVPFALITRLRYCTENNITVTRFKMLEIKLELENARE